MVCHRDHECASLKEKSQRFGKATPSPQNSPGTQLLDEASAEFLVDKARKQSHTKFLAKTTLGNMQQATQTQPDGVDPHKLTNGRVAGSWRAFVGSVSTGSGRLADARSCSRQHAALFMGGSSISCDKARLEKLFSRLEPRSRSASPRGKGTSKRSKRCAKQMRRCARCRPPISSRRWFSKNCHLGWEVAA